MYKFRSRKPEARSKVGRDHAPRLTRKRDVLLAFAIVSLPFLIIASILIAFLFNTTRRERPDNSIGTPDLPIEFYDTATAYYTGMRPGAFLLLGSWASNVAEIVVAPFMVIFSYIVAREILKESIEDRANSHVRPPLLGEILKGGHVGLWHWGGHVFRRGNRLSNLRVLNVAGFGLLTATFLTILVIVGDNWLHATTQAIRITHYDFAINANSSDFTYQDDQNVTQSLIFPSFEVNDTCSETLTNTLPPDVPPCSLADTNGVTNVAVPEVVYLTLAQGITQINSSFNGIDFNSHDSEEVSGKSTALEVVTSLQNGTSHAVFFNVDAAEEFDLSDYGSNFGYDFVGSTMSMTTQCTVSTRDCGIRALESGLIRLDQNNISIPFHCYDGFSGNLGQTPETGHERAQGWNMSFYDVVDGSPQNIPIQAQLNPFRFYVVAAVNSVSSQDLQQSGDPEVDSDNGSLVDVGGGFTAFALKCEATIHEVKLSLVNGSFSTFQASDASPAKASIFKAPLQVGFGQYHLYEAARVAVISDDTSLEESMSTALSQTGMALASGVFLLTNDGIARRRWEVPVTQVLKAPFWFLVIICLVYSVFGMVMTAMAFYLRRQPDVRDHQAKLMGEWAPELRKVDAEGRKAIEKRNEERSSERDWSNFSSGLD